MLDVGAQHEFRYAVENIDFYPEYFPGTPGDHLTGLNLFYLRGPNIAILKNGVSTPPVWEFHSSSYYYFERYIDYPNSCFGGPTHLARV